MWEKYYIRGSVDATTSRRTFSCERLVGSAIDENSSVIEVPGAGMVDKKILAEHYLLDVPRYQRFDLHVIAVYLQRYCGFTCHLDSCSVGSDYYFRRRLHFDRFVLFYNL